MRAVDAVVPDRDDSVGLRIGQRLEQNRVDRAEDGRAGANAEGEREHAEDREPRRTAQPAEGVTGVRERCADDVLPPVRSHLFLRDRGVAERHTRGPPGVIGGESAANQIRRRLVVVVLHFVRDVAIHGSSVRERVHAVCELTPQRHG
jgi:hypothetical protein